MKCEKRRKDGTQSDFEVLRIFCGPPITATHSVTSFGGDGVAQFVFTGLCAPPQAPSQTHGLERRSSNSGSLLTQQGYICNMEGLRLKTKVV